MKTDFNRNGFTSKSVGQPKKMNSPFSSVVKQNQFRRDFGEWDKIVNYLYTETNIKKNMCVGCGKGYLYNNKGVSYEVNRSMKLDAVKSIVSSIKEQNSTPK